MLKKSFFLIPSVEIIPFQHLSTFFLFTEDICVTEEILAKISGETLAVLPPVEIIPFQHLNPSFLSRKITKPLHLPSVWLHFRRNIIGLYTAKFRRSYGEQFCIRLK